MPTATLPSPYPSLARNFVFTAIACSVGLFGLLKFRWVELHAVLPLTQYQGRLAEAVFGAAALPIDVTLACSGTDAIALCVGAIMAYPAGWRLRLGGAVGGVFLIVMINIARIGSLGRLAASPLWFEVLHVYVWPAFLVLAISGYVFTWMRHANARARMRLPDVDPPAATRRTSTFVIWTVTCVTLFIATSSLYLQSSIVLDAATAVAQSAAVVLSLIGITATTIGNTLWTAKGGFEVTQECISTPLIPLYGATVMTYFDRWRWRIPLLAAAVPLFLTLGIARLLVVALPAVLIGSPLFLIHAFYQILLAVALVATLGIWRRGAVAWRRIATACVIGVVAASLLGPIYHSVLSALGLAIPFNDSQGAMAWLPSFQVGFYIALSIASLTLLAWRWFAAGLFTLVMVQAAVFAIALALSQHGVLAPHIRDVRAWAVALPFVTILIVLAVHDRSRR